MARRSGQLDVGGRRIEVANLDKVFYPGGRKFRKGDVIDFYVAVADALLPHLRARPVTLLRVPDGVAAESFYEKDAPRFTPDWVRTVPVPRREGGTPIRYIVIDDLATLVWLVNLANLEIHPFLHLASHLDRPTQAVFDLDPGEGAGLADCARVAGRLHDLLGELGLDCFAKVTGSKGLQVHLPLGGEVSYAMTMSFTKAVARILEQRHPDLVVTEMSRALRTGKVFIDWSQNSDYKTTVSVYSLRAKDAIPFVAMPVRWEELSDAARSGDARGLVFTPGAARRRLAATGDLFAPLLSLRQELPQQVTAAFAGKAQRPRTGARPAAVRGEAALDDYRAKRDFSRTPEPARGKPRSSRQGSRRRFVVQKHAASHLHYDFRLEMHGVLKSWAVPKGPSMTNDEARLARATEDHPLDYLDFEGIIPKGQYGGGTVMVWDIGNYELVEGNWYEGFLRVFLDGSKLHGEWLLRAEDAERTSWRLVRSGRTTKAPTPEEDDRSALSGRTMRQIADAADAVWQSHRGDGSAGERGDGSAGKRRVRRKPASSVARKRADPSAADGAERELRGLPSAKLAFVEPMLASPAQRLPAGPGWAYELKLDGYRAMAVRTRSGLQLLSRRGRRLDGGRYAAVRAALEDLPPRSIVDGELVALDEHGRPSFEALQNAGNAPAAIHYYLFDLLALQGSDLRQRPYAERRHLLESKVMPLLHEPLRLSMTLDADAASVIEAVKAQDLEGVVAKRLDSSYESGQRSGAWRKVKTSRGQELVIGGFLPGPNGFESLLVGHYEKRRLHYDGKLHAGFVPELRRRIAERMAPLVTGNCPFANLPEKRRARRGEAVTEEVMARCRWLQPKLVAQVQFQEWTRGGRLRHPRFAGLRDDKDAREVTRE